MKHIELRKCLWCDKEFISRRANHYFCNRTHAKKASNYRHTVHFKRIPSQVITVCKTCDKTIKHWCAKVATQRRIVGIINHTKNAYITN